jgi:hypothetical protein
MRHVVFVGNSHLLALFEAALSLNGAVNDRTSIESMWRSRDLQARTVELPGPQPARVSFVLVGGLAPPFVRFDPSAFLRIEPASLFTPRRRYLRAIDEAVADLDGRVDQVVSCFLGNEHTIFSLMEHPVPFDVLVDDADAGVAPEGPLRQIVPLDAMRRELAARANPTVLSCGILRARFPETDVVHVMPPPPIPDEEQIRARPEVFGNVIKRFGLAPAALRRKIYVLYTDALEEALGACGVRLLTAPECAMTDGYLKPEFWMEATHANHHYGRLVLEQLAAS